MRIFSRLCAFVLAAVALFTAAYSLTFPLQSDTPIMLYLGQMVANGAVPYRDFLDMNMPGSYLFFAAIAKFFGVSRIAAMCVNLFVCLFAAAIFFCALRRFGRLFALTVASLLILRLLIVQAYIFTLEREVVAMPLIGLIVWIALGRHSGKTLAWVLLGLLSALLFLIKPQFVLFALPSAILMWREHGFSLKGVVWVGIAFSVPCLCSLLWLLSNGAWEGLKQWAQYTPLYGGMDFSNCYGDTQVWKLRRTIALAWRFLLFTPYTALAVAGLASAYFRSSLPNRKHTAVFFASLLIVSLVVSSFSGQLWGYHRIPYFICAFVCSSLLVAGGKPERAIIGVFSLAVSGVCLAALLGFRDIAVDTPMRQRTLDGVSSFLAKNLKAGEKVQPDDWAHEMLNAMLRAKAPLATRFPYTFYFYHSLSSPVIQNMRKEFLADLRAGKAKYIIRAKHRDYVKGADTERVWKEYEDFLATRCKVAEETGDYVIYDCEVP